MYEINSKLESIKLAREGAGVKRCHTIPIIGEYVVGYHTFNMLCMLKIIRPKSSINLVWAIVEHDAPERLTGDIPAPPKWYGIINGDFLISLETEIVIQIYGEDTVQRLTEEELMFLAGLDILELYMFCKDQTMLGNRNVEVMMDRIERFVMNNCEKFPADIIGLLTETKNSGWHMMPDLGDDDV